MPKEFRLVEEKQYFEILNFLRFFLLSRQTSETILPVIFEYISTTLFSNLFPNSVASFDLNVLYRNFERL
jgi:hypothetical protein